MDEKAHAGGTKEGPRQRFWRTTMALLVSGALVLSGTPTVALADTGSGGSQQGSSQPSAAPGGGGQSQGGGPAGGTGAGGGADTMTFDYSGTYAGTISADGSETGATGKSFDSSTTDQNAALAQNEGTLNLQDVTLTKSGDDTDGDNCNFYGVNSILTAVGSRSFAYVSGSTLSATSEGSNAIFATDGATVYAKDDTITTTAGNSRGLDATYDGTIIADGLDVSTQGDHCAGVATDRGGGSVSLTDSTLSTAGSGSPLLYSTGDIEVSGVTGTAKGSQLCGMEGLNTILINDSTLESTITSATASDPIADGVIIYQSTSGDAESTTGEAATFQASGSTLKSAITSGAMFYLTNTSANIVLADTTLDFDTSAAKLLEASGNDSNNWGTAGSNGATVTLTGIGQTLDGDIDVDTISSVDLYLLEGSTWPGTGTISKNSAGVSTSNEPLKVSVDSSSTWVVTADTTVSSLAVADGGKVVDEGGKTVTIVAGGSTVVSGDSAYTITVTGSYGTTVSTGTANELSSDLIDRSDFDTHYGCQTSFTMGSTQTTSATTAATTASTTATATAATTSATSTSWWDSFVGWWRSLLGL